MNLTELIIVGHLNFVIVLSLIYRSISPPLNMKVSNNWSISHKNILMIFLTSIDAIKLLRRSSLFFLTSIDDQVNFPNVSLWVWLSPPYYRTVLLGMRSQYPPLNFVLCDQEARELLNQNGVYRRGMIAVSTYANFGTLLGPPKITSHSQTFEFRPPNLLRFILVIWTATQLQSFVRYQYYFTFLL